MELHTCAVTGHRPTRFKWKYKENNNGCKRLKKWMHDQFIALYEKGVRQFLVGGGLGVDQWDPRSRERLAFLIRHSAECVTVGKAAGRESFTQRNRYMVDHAGCLLAVYDGVQNLESWTTQTVNYAENKSLSIVFIHPDSAKVLIHGE